MNNLKVLQKYLFQKCNNIKCFGWIKIFSELKPKELKRFYNFIKSYPIKNKEIIIKDLFKNVNYLINQDKKYNIIRKKSIFN